MSELGVREFPYFHEHHLIYGFKEPGVMYTKIGACPARPSLALDEAVRAARLIAELARDANQSLILCMSGGIDSEAMALAFLAANEPFKVAILKMTGGLNEFDIHMARDFCVARSIPFEEIELDAVDFFDRRRHLEYASLDQCRSPQLALHCEFISHVRGFPVLAGNPCVPLWRGGILELPLLAEPHVCIVRYLRRQARFGVPYFFFYTPELIHSFWLTEILTERLLAEPDEQAFHRHAETFARPVPTMTDLRYLDKVLAFQQGGFAVQARDGKKTGFEEIKDHYARTWFKKGFDERYLGDGVFEYLYRRPLERALPYPRQFLRIVDRTHFPHATATAQGR